MKRTTLVISLSILVLSCLFAVSALRHPASHAVEKGSARATPATSAGEKAATTARVGAPSPAVSEKAQESVTAQAAPTKSKAPAPAPAHEPRRGPAAAALAARFGLTGGGDGDAEPKKELTQKEIERLWPYSATMAVSPVLSPALRDTPAHASVADPSLEVENRPLPFKGLGFPPDSPLSAARDGAVQNSFGTSLLTASGVNFDGLVANGFAPPDSDGRVGPNHYIQWINVNFAIYDKSGTLLYGPAAGNSLFTALGPSSPCVLHNDGDPLVVYDALADRWVLTQFAVDAPPTGQSSYQCTAVSATGDPLGAYYLYAFPLAPNAIYDYPHTGVWPDSYYTTYHVFNGAGTAFLNQGLVAFERGAMIAGLPARFVITNMDPTGNFFGALPADLDGLTPPPAGSPAFVVAPGAPEYDGTPTPVLHFWTAATTWGATPATVLTGPTDLAAASFNTNLCGFARNCVPEPGTTAANFVDAIPGRLMNRVAYRNFGAFESIVLSDTVNTLVPPANHAGVRWYELRSPGSTPTIFQQGTFSPDTNWRWMPSVAMDNGGNIAAGYSKSSGTVLPEIDVAGRLSTDALGTLGTETVMQPGVGIQTGTGNRWGDYSAMTVDPRDGCTFWYTNQYQPAGAGTFNWKTRIASFRFAPSECASPAKGTLTGTVRDGAGAPIEGALVSLDNGASGATNGIGVYTIVTVPGTYNVSVTAPLHPGCISPPGSVVTIANGGVTTRNFTLPGTASLTLGTPVIDDSIGNNNGVINRNECVRLELPLDNVGCGVGSGISAILTTSTAGVTVTQPASAYPNIPAGQVADSSTPFQITTSAAFACGTPIDFTLTVTSSSGSTPFAFSLPTCAAPVAVQSGSITNTDLLENARLGRTGIGSTCAGKVCPGALGAGTRSYDAYNFTNFAADARCITVTVDAACAPASNGDVFSGAYIGTFDPTQLCLNYAGDLGGSPVNGTSASYGFTVPAGANFVVVVNESTAGAGCSNYTLHVNGLLDNTDGGRPAAPTAGNDGPICEGQTLDLTATTIPLATYAWTGPNGFTSTLQNPSIPAATVAASGVYTVIATVGGCTADAATTTATVNPTPAAPVASSNSPVTAGQTIQLNATTVPGASYAWTGPNGFTSNLQNPSIPSATSANAGVYSVIATIGTCSSPAATTTVVISQFAPETLQVDQVFVAGTLSNANSVFEQGEIVLVNPGWMNQGSASVSLTGIASNFTGPAGPAYTIVDNSADYGPMSPGATTNCQTATGNCYQLGIGPGARPAAHWDTTVDETLSDGTTKTWTLHVGGSFSDVPVGTGFYRFVETIFHKGITTGCGANTFCPATAVNRAQDAVFLLLAEHGSGYTPPPAVGLFNDVPVSSPFAPFVEQLVAEGITAGCGNNNFCPADSVTRAQSAVFLLRAEHGPTYVPPPAVGLFADVPVSSPFAPWVEQLVAEGVTVGCGGGNFCPADPVSRGQNAVFLTTTFKLNLYGP